MSAKTIEQVIEAAIVQESQKEAPERRPIPWDDGRERLLVVNLPLAPLQLNPYSHRIKAQLAAQPDRARLLSEPFSEETQNVIATLLRATEGFEDLKSALADEGQSDPGVVTREGVFLNANTRAVALRDLNSTHIRVMVLPSGATPAQLTELELRLQVSKDYKQDYTFTNRLLFIKDCRDAGWSDARIAREVHGTVGSEGKRIGEVRRDLRMLVMIDELIEMSNGMYGYPDFDDKSVALKELDGNYEEVKKTDPDAALRLRTARQVAMLCGVAHRRIRHVDQDFVSTYLEEEIEDDESIKFLLDDTDAGDEDEPEGMDLLGDSDDSTQQSGETLLRWLTQTAGQKEVQVPTEDTGSVDRLRIDVVDGLRTAVEKAVETVKTLNQRGDLLSQPLDATKAALKKLQAAETAYRKTQNDPKFSSEVNKLRDRLAAVRRLTESLNARLDSDFPRGDTP